MCTRVTMWDRPSMARMERRMTTVLCGRPITAYAQHVLPSSVHATDMDEPPTVISPLFGKRPKNEQRHMEQFAALDRRLAREAAERNRYDAATLWRRAAELKQEIHKKKQEMDAFGESLFNKFRQRCYGRASSSRRRINTENTRT